MNEAEAEAIIQRTGATASKDSWRSKNVWDMTDAELAEAMNDTRQAKFSAEAWYESEEPMDYEDRAYAYESMLRCMHQLTAYEKESNRRKTLRFDVV